MGSLRLSLTAQIAPATIRLLLLLLLMLLLLDAGWPDAHPESLHDVVPTSMSTSRCNGVH